MKKLIFILLFSSSLFSQKNDVKKVIDNFFIGLNSKDTIVINLSCHPDIFLQTILNTKDGDKLKTDSFPDFLKSIATIPKDVTIEEKSLKYEIKIDGSLAHVWTPYEFYIDKKLSHKGVNSFTLVKENDKWLIIHVIDTRKK